MDIPKAIEILNINITKVGRRMPPDTLDALKLGVQALTRVIADRYGSDNPVFVPLEGETVATDSP